MDKILKILNFLRITDADNKLSITNLGVVAALVFVAFYHENVEQYIPVAIAIVNYAYKRYMEATNKPPVDLLDVEKAKVLMEDIKSLKNDINAIKIEKGLRL